jgi:hypothetical protein
MYQGHVKRIYLTFGIVSITAFLWIAWNLIFPYEQLPACPFHTVTGIGCPSCGVTRSVLSISAFDFSAAWHYNPLGFPAMLLMLSVPPLIAFDLVKKENYFYRYYCSMESFLKRRKWFSAILVSVLLINWYFQIR